MTDAEVTTLAAVWAAINSASVKTFRGGDHSWIEDLIKSALHKQADWVMNKICDMIPPEQAWLFQEEYNFQVERVMTLSEEKDTSHAVDTSRPPEHRSQDSDDETPQGAI